MRPIFIAASPNTESDDLCIALREIISIGNWQKQSLVSEFEKAVSAYFGRTAVAFDSARSSLYIYLKVMGWEKGSEVLLPAFSCMVVANAVIWAGYKPVYVDCNKENFNLDLNDLKKKISPRTKALLIQNTFGFPEDYDTVRGIIGREIVLIEDLAHSLGGKYKNMKLGSIGDASILTFGIEKVISGVRGGMLVLKDSNTAQEVKKVQSQIPCFPKRKVLVSMMNPIYWKLVTPLYYWGFGKFTLGKLKTFLAHKLGILGNMIEDCEYRACRPSWLPSKMAGSLARLGLNQFRKLDKLNQHRILISKIYSKLLDVQYGPSTGSEHIYLRFPVIVKDQKELIIFAKKQHVILGDWYKNILYAPGRSLAGLGYLRGTAPNAEYLAKHIVNLPTGINVRVEDAIRIASFVKPYLYGN